MWRILPKYSKTSELFKLAKDLVERFEKKEVPVKVDDVHFVDEKTWAQMHGGIIEERWDAAHIIRPDGTHEIAFRKKTFEEEKKKLDGMTFRIYFLETTIHELLHSLGIRDDEEVGRKTKEILRKLMNIKSR